MSEDASNTDELKLPARHAVEVYPSEGGYVCIKQDENHPHHDEPALIMLLPSDIPTICKWLKQVADEIDEATKDS